MNVQNRRTKAVHSHMGGHTSCGIRIAADDGTYLPRWVPVTYECTCHDCMRVTNDSPDLPLTSHASELHPDFAYDPNDYDFHRDFVVDLTDDIGGDLPDGAYWALFNELEEGFV